MLNNNEYEVQVIIDGILYNVTCEVFKDGVFLDFPETRDEPGCYEIVEEPSFHKWYFEDWDTGLEIEPTNSMKSIAEVLVNEQYWSCELQ